MQYDLTYMWNLKKERKKEKAQTRMYTKKHWWLPQPVGGQNK